MVDGSLPDNVMVPTVEGDMTARDALTRLLDGSGLSWRSLDANTISIQEMIAGDVGNGEVVTAPVQVSAGRNAVGYNGNPDWVYDTPGSVTVITAENIRKVPGRDAADIFSQVPGVDVAGNRQQPGLSVNVRGQQDQGRVNMNIDGARQNFNQSGHGVVNRMYIDTALLADVTVEKSNFSGVGGAGTSGGIVSMRTLNTDDILDADEDIGGKINLSRGNNEYDFAGDVSVAARVTPKFDVAVAFSRKLVGEYKGGENNPGLYITRPQSGAGTLVEAGGEEQRYTDQQQSAGLFKANIALSEDQDLNLGYVGFTTNFGKATGEDLQYNDLNEATSHTVTAKHSWNPETDLIDLKTGLWWTQTENKQFRPARYTAAGAVSTDAFNTEYKIDTYGFDVANTSQFYLDEVISRDSIFSLDYGVETFQDKTKTGSETLGLGGAGFGFELEGSTPNGQRDVQGAFMDGTFDWGGLVQLTGGLRYDRFQLDGDSYWCEQYNPANTCESGGTPLDIDLSGHKISPSVTLGLSPFEGIQFFGSYRRAYRPPTIMEGMIKGRHVAGVPIPFYANPDLESEDSFTTEFGVNLKFDDVFVKNDGFRAKLSHYQTKIENYIVSAAVAQPTPRTISAPLGWTQAAQAQSYVNLLDPVYMSGNEVEVAYDAEKIYLSGSMAFSDTDLTGNYDPIIFPLNAIPSMPGTVGLPAHWGKAGGLTTVYTLPKRKYTLDGGVRMFDQSLTLGARATFVYPEENIAGNLGDDAQSILRYRTYDLYSSYEFNDNVKFGFAVNNLTDEAYVEALGGLILAPGRTAIMTLSGNF
ncbi:TonB-dependent receptor [Thalassospira sp.]|uniref:TonB-dependent receptor n=1 Tax=Thalassospira sp. TaxID=1912094 RepID=UPI002735C478|nr:TonB-dependent receptor [Thalassospira sp.]MDP2699342.1 TonB-dependent receptor [Thalassospira sp.]